MKGLVPAKKWIKETFPEGGVGPARVEKWVRRKVIPGLIIDGDIFVYADKAALIMDNTLVLEPSQPSPESNKTSDIVSDIVNGALSA